MYTYKVLVEFAGGRIIYPPGFDSMVKAEDIVNAEYRLEEKAVYITLKHTLPTSDKIILLEGSE